jgi:hypothetical protein
VVRHFLLTKFNVARYDHVADRYGQTVRTPDWLEERLVLFETFCLPSIAGQTSLDFTWLISYGADSEPAFLAELGRGRAEFPFVLVPETTSFEDAVAERLDPAASVVITTRIDNDDAFRRDALEVVRASAGAAREFLNFPWGYSLDFPSGEARLTWQPSNPFLSLVEPAGAEVGTVLRVSHNEAERHAPVRQLRDWS